MDRKIAKIVQDEAAAALVAIAAKHGMTVRAHGGQLADISMVLKFEFKTADTAAIADAEKAEFEACAAIFGLEAGDFGATFHANGQTYKVVGLNLKRRKYPIVVENAQGKRQLFTDMVVDRIKLAAPRGGTMTPKEIEAAQLLLVTCGSAALNWRCCMISAPCSAASRYGSMTKARSSSICAPTSATARRCASISSTSSPRRSRPASRRPWITSRISA